MRVLLTTDPIGGVWTFTVELSQELLRLGHSVHLLSFGRTLSPSQAEWCLGTADHAGNAFSWEVTLAPLEWMQDNERAWDSGAAAISHAIADFRPEILHANQFCFGYTDASLPCVITAHSDVLSWAEACRPGGLDPSKWLDTYRKLVGRGLEAATLLAAPTQWMADALARHWVLRHPANVIANGRSVVGTSSAKARKMQALSAGRMWDEAKGLATLLERDWPMPVLVAGEETFEGARAESSIGIHALGTLSQEAMLAAMRESAVYLGTSLYEPFGLAPLEAAQCGCALVLRDLQSFREIWGDAAMYFADADSLASALRALRDHDDLLARMQSAALRRASKYSASAMAAAYVRLYENAIALHGKQLSSAAHLECDAA